MGQLATKLTGTLIIIAVIVAVIDWLSEHPFITTGVIIAGTALAILKIRSLLTGKGKRRRRR